MTRGKFATVIALSCALLFGGIDAAEAQECRVMEFEFTPTRNLQMVIWLEDKAGNFVETVFITQATGTYGIGNRPGRWDHNSSWAWPYGRRTNVFPVWANRRGVEYPKLVFQDEDDADLSHPISQSSVENHFCRPLDPTKEKDAGYIDTLSCATPSYTDKGMFHPTDTVLYPPRADLNAPQEADHPDVGMFDAINDLDVISRATPPGGMLYGLYHSITEDIPEGEYVAWIEVSKEFDQNAHYDLPQPDASQIPNWRQYGEPWRGQPSVLWKVDLVLSAQQPGFTASALQYAGYSDVMGLDETLFPPDNTITTGVEGSGAERLLRTAANDGDYRFRVTVHSEDDAAPPSTMADLRTTTVSANGAMLEFTAPHDDQGGPESGSATRYEIRYLIGETINADNFLSGQLIEGPAPAEPGTLQQIELSDLLPQTMYSVGIRAQDECLNNSELAVMEFATPRAEGGEVGGCALSHQALAEQGGQSGLPAAGFLALLGLAFLRRFR